MSLSTSCSLPQEECAPLKHMIIDRKSEKLEQHLICQVFDSSSQVWLQLRIHFPRAKQTDNTGLQVDLRASLVNKIQLQLAASESAWR